MNKIQDELSELLKKDKRLVADGKLMKNKVIEFALKLDKDLLKLLSSNKSVKAHFFQEVDNMLVFDKVKFQDFINLKSFLADSYTKYKSKIGLEADGDYLSKSKDVVLVWPYKDCLLEGGQTKAERENRTEIFWNETLAPEHYDRLLSPKAFLNFKKYDSKGEHELKGKIDFGKENLIIKGNNLLALHSLKERFEGQVKLIYIDPPYNTGTDEFGYNDSFSHSTWLTFMRNRLEIAKQLLNNNGVAFIQIDERELAYLKVLCDEVFNRENFVVQINWQRTTQRSVLGQGATAIINIVEYILCYVNDLDYKEDALNKIQKTIPSNDKMYNQYNLLMKAEGERKLFKTLNHNGHDINIFKHSNFKIESIPVAKRNEEYYKQNLGSIVRKDSQQEESSLEQMIISNIQKNDTLFTVERVLKQGKRKGELNKSFYMNDNVIYHLSKYAEVINGKIFRKVDMNNLWLDYEISSAGIADEGNVKLKRGKKPEELIKRIIEIATNDKNDIVLDFHLGSGTTAAVAHKLDRRYIGLEQLDYDKNDSVIRLKNVIGGDNSGISSKINWKGGGSFIYCELAQDNAQYIDKIENAKKTEELKKIWEEMQQEGFISHRIKETEVFNDEGAIKWKDLSLKEQKQILIRTLDLNHLYINYSEIDDARYKKVIDEETKNLNNQFYSAK